MDCFSCEDMECIMKLEPYAGVQPCFYCERAEEGVIDDACLICITGQICCFVEREG